MRLLFAWVGVTALLACLAVDLYWHIRFDVCIRQEIFLPLYFRNMGWIVPSTLAFAVVALVMALIRGPSGQRRPVKPFLVVAIVASVAIFAGAHTMDLLP